MTRWRKRGTTWEPVHPETPGYRDIYCPLCGRGPFINAYGHITKVHGIKRFEAATRWPGLSRLRGSLPPHAEYGGGYPGFKPDHRRHQRWHQALQEEVAKGDYWVSRLATRWRVTYMTAYQRVGLLRDAGFDVPPPPGKGHKATCRRGHPMTEENTRLDHHKDKDRWVRTCRTCERDNQRARRSQKRGSSP